MILFTFRKRNHTAEVTKQQNDAACNTLDEVPSAKEDCRNHCTSLPPENQHPLTESREEPRIAAIKNKEEKKPIDDGSFGAGQQELTITAPQNRTECISNVAAQQNGRPEFMDNVAASQNRKPECIDKEEASLPIPHADVTSPGNEKIASKATDEFLTEAMLTSKVVDSSDVTVTGNKKNTTKEQRRNNDASSEKYRKKMKSHLKKKSLVDRLFK